MLKWIKFLIWIGNGTTHKLLVQSFDPKTVLLYNIAREERFKFDGSYETSSQDFLTQINQNTGLIQVKSSQLFKNYSSILVVVNVKDINKSVKIFL